MHSNINVEISNNTAKMLVKAWTDGDAKFKNVNCTVDANEYVVKADEKFECRPI